MQRSYGRDLDLNLLRVFAVVAECGSVTEAAGHLYVTQPAISAALRRLTSTVGAPLFVRHGRGLALTKRGDALLASVRPHLQAIVDAALSEPVFDPATSDRTFRLGLGDSMQGWLLPPLLSTLAEVSPLMRLIVTPVQFRNVADALTTRRVDIAVTVADDLPAGIRRVSLFTGKFVCLFDPRFTTMGKNGPLRERDYFAHEHVVVSYNGDFRGVVEDALQRTRRARCSLPNLSHVGAVIDGSPLLATVPTPVAAQIRATRPHLRAVDLPFALKASAIELLWPAVLDEDPAGRFLRDRIVDVASHAADGAATRKPKRRARAA